MIVLFTGPVGSGKTTLLEAVVEGARARGVRVGGYLSRRIVGRRGELLGYDLVPLDGEPAVPFLRPVGEEAGGEQRVGAWSVLPAGLARAKAILRTGAAGGWLVVDEVGPLELRGRGVWPALAPGLSSAAGHRLLVAREKIAGALAARFPGRVDRVFRVGEPGLPGSLVEHLAGAGSKARE